MKKLLLLTFVILLNKGFAQQEESYKYTISVANVFTYVDAKPLYDPIRTAAKCKIINFNEENHVFEFKSSQDLSEAKFIDLFNIHGYTLASYQRRSLITLKGQ